MTQQMTLFDDKDFDEDAEKEDLYAYNTDEPYADAVQKEDSAGDKTAGMKTISIRLPVKMIEAFKLIADIDGVAYQPLMRNVLERFSEQTLKRIACNVNREQIKKAKLLLDEAD